MNKLESKFQGELIKELKVIFPGCIVLKNDPLYLQGVPDLIILYNDRWAMLECKKEKGSRRQPNQEFYIQKLGNMSYANFIYPENRKEVLNELQQALSPRGSTCVSRGE